jgi:hypothetical protein
VRLAHGLLPLNHQHHNTLWSIYLCCKASYSSCPCGAATPDFTLAMPLGSPRRRRATPRRHHHFPELHSEGPTSRELESALLGDKTLKVCTNTPLLLSQSPSPPPGARGRCRQHLHIPAPPRSWRRRWIFRQLRTCNRLMFWGVWGVLHRRNVRCLRET